MKPDLQENLQVNRIVSACSGLRGYPQITLDQFWQLESC
jgi:hypothetical protein